MQYYDIGLQALRQNLQQIPFSRKSSGGSVHDHNSFDMEGSGEYIGSNDNNRNGYSYMSSFKFYCGLKYLRQRWKELLIVLLVIGVLVLAKPHEREIQRKTLSLEEKEKFMYIISEKGNKYKLDYRKPQIIRPARLEQKPIPLLSIPDSQKMDKLLKDIGSPLDFKSKLFLNWFNKSEDLFQAEFFQYNKKYNLSVPVIESPLCILSPFRNVVSSSETSWKLFIQSIDSQNYSNYHVYMVDDVSTDNSSEIMLDQIRKKYPRLNNRVTVIRNKDHVGALGNRDSVIRNHCKPEDIVVDIDGDDALIGKQVFNLVNRIYRKNENVWFMYMNYLSVMGRMKGEARNVDYEEIMQPGICQPIKAQTFKNNSYRTNFNQWVTSELRTYLRDLYVKIPLKYVIEQGTRSYYFEASDRFSMYSLVELAGPNHTMYVEEYVYFYFEPNFLILDQKQCTLPQLFFSEAQARVLTPLVPLQNLSQSAEMTKNYTIAKDIVSFYLKKWYLFLECHQKLEERKKKVKAS